MADVEVVAGREVERERNPGGDREHGNGDGHHALADAADDNRRGSRLGLIGDALGGAERLGGVVLGRAADHDAR